MCGICGIFSSSVARDLAGTGAIARRMMRDMRARGPDDEGFWTDGASCALGFRRLSILDLTPAGHQPMATADGRHALVLNGEVYNYRDLRRELEGRGVRFRSTGDAEVVLHALAEWGAPALERFNGMYALGFYDAVGRTLLLARDHAGIKPLYFHRSDDGVVFASQLGHLLHHPWTSDRRVSTDGLALYLRFGFVPAPFTILEQISELEAGAWVRFDADGRVERGVSFAFPRFVTPSLRGHDALEAVDEAVRRAVGRSLISDVPVGVFLSGGIDSPLVAAEAARQTTGRLDAFTIGTDDPETDESAAARRYAREIDAHHVVRIADERAALDLIGAAIDAYTEPNADYSIFPTLLVSRTAREHVKVVLAGDGGDELFWGYTHRFGGALDRLRLPHDGDVGRFLQTKHTLMPERDLEAALPTLPPLPEGFDLFRFANAGVQETAQWLRWNEYYVHLARVLAKVDRASMYESLEVRVPLLDKEVIAAAVRVDWTSCLDARRRIGKLPLRLALKKRVRFQSFSKKGFTVPMERWLVGPLRGLVRDRLLEGHDLLGLELDRAHLAHMFARLEAGERKLAWGLWLLLNLSLWEERHLAGARLLWTEWD